MAKAKVNLFLHVTGKREDGYHLLESLVVFPDLSADKITLKNAPNFTFDIIGPFAGALAKEDPKNNLVLMAHDLLQNFTGRSLPCSIQLEKKPSHRIWTWWRFIGCRRYSEGDGTVF
jgi:4-diphosphocytidyl-2-C-methyl-D-erythritol kinase